MIEPTNWMAIRQLRMKTIIENLIAEDFVTEVTISDLETKYAFHYEGKFFSVNIHSAYFSWYYSQDNLPIYEERFWETFHKKQKILKTHGRKIIAKKPNGYIHLRGRY